MVLKKLILVSKILKLVSKNLVQVLWSHGLVFNNLNLVL